jgi:PAS domain S-box-containing protein
MEEESGAPAAELGHLQAQLSALMANVPGAIYRCANDRDWSMEMLTDEIERMTGYPASDFIDNRVRTFASLVHPDDWPTVTRLIEEAIAEDRIFVLEYRIFRRDGGIRWVLERGQQVKGPDGRCWLDGAIFDITERRSAEERLRRSEAERARLAEVAASQARIVAAADEARRRIERDLHDGAQQRLVALTLRLRVARSRMSDDDPVAAELEAAIDESQAAADELRELARGIHPAILTERGLGPAVESLAARTPLVVEVSDELGERLPDEVELAAYYTVAEALTNVVRHAQAERAEVTLARPGPGRLRVTVRDDGVGGAELGGGSGLRGLGDRAGALGGEVAVSSPAGEGTCVEASFPVAPVGG